VEPIPETRKALRLLAAGGDQHLGRDLDQAARALAGRMSGLVGFSITVVEQGVTFTYLASGLDVAGLDAVQYLDGGPCEEAMRAGERIQLDHADLMDERRWQLFAQAGDASGVASTLSLPIIEAGQVVGGVNLYGAEADTFEGRHEELAGLFGAWAPGAVSNADLSFSSRMEAARAVDRLEELALVDLAVGVLVAAHGIGPQEARARLERAAARAGVSVAQVAQLVTGHESRP